MGMKGTSNIVANRTGSSLAPLCKRKRVTVIDFDSIRHDDRFVLMKLMNFSLECSATKLVILSW